MPGPEASGRAEEDSRNFYLESLKFGALIQEERIDGTGQQLELLDAGRTQEPGDKMARYREMRSRNRRLTDRAGGRGRPATASGLGEDERSALEALEAALDDEDEVKSYYAEPVKGEEEGGGGMG